MSRWPKAADTSAAASRQPSGIAAALALIQPIGLQFKDTPHRKPLHTDPLVREKSNFP
jgi:hypothetical protein